MGVYFSTDEAVGLSHLRAPPKAVPTPLQDVAKGRRGPRRQSVAQAASQGRKAAQGVTELGSLGTAASLAPGSLLLIV